MKITAVEAHVVAPGHRRPMLLVRVLTDAGHYGVGECSPMNVHVLRTFVTASLGPMIVGMEAMETEKIWRRMMFGAYKLGPGGAQFEAMAGIDIALWDIKGKALGVPVHTLLGGKVRDKVAFYASLPRYDTPEEACDVARACRDQGYSAVKFHTAHMWGFDKFDDDTLPIVRASRKELGDGFGLMVDVNCGYTTANALRIGLELEQLGVAHFEEPVAEYDRKGLAQLADALSMPVSAGEQCYSRWQHRDLIEEGRPDILQPDVVKTGISELVKIVALASVHNIPVALHNIQPTVGTAATLQCAAAFADCTYLQEFGITDHPSTNGLFREIYAPVDGHIPAPDLPGLGLELDETRLAELTA
jgi:L-alanine-DL-glutamate epimerase-like enolase superfamily enzyme